MREKEREKERRRENEREEGWKREREKVRASKDLYRGSATLREMSQLRSSSQSKCGEA